MGGGWTKTKLMLFSTQVEVEVELKLELSLAIFVYVFDGLEVSGLTFTIYLPRLECSVVVYHGDQHSPFMTPPSVCIIVLLTPHLHNFCVIVILSSCLNMCVSVT